MGASGALSPTVDVEPAAWDPSAVLGGAPGDSEELLVLVLLSSHMELRSSQNFCKICELVGWYL